MTTLKLFVSIFLVAIVIFVGKIDVKAEVTAYDADGQFLGVLLGKDNVTGGAFNIYMPSYGKLIQVIVSSTRDHASIGMSNLNFESADCSGVAYVEPWASTEIIKNNGQYYTGELIGPTNITVNSRLFGWSSVCETLGGAFNQFLVPAGEVDLPVSEPITLPLSFELEPSHPGKWKK